MIEKMTSHELNNIFNNANDKLNNIIDTIKLIKNNTNKKIKILRYEAEYMENALTTLRIKSTSSSKNLTVFDNTLAITNHSKYGCTVLPRFKKISNALNVVTVDTTEAFYRDIADVSVNDVTKEEYKTIFMHDNNKDKDVFFEEISEDNSEFKVSISIDKTKTIGKTTFNMIELDTFFSGSFDIKSIKIYTSDNREYFDEFTEFNHAGKMRITFEKEYELNKVDIIFKPNYSVEVDQQRIYPFGIKHIYFYNAKYSTNSYAIAVIEREEFIDTIKNTIEIKTPNAVRESTILNENIELYLNCEINDKGEVELSSPQEVSTSQSINPIGINIKKIYAKVPLKDESIIGIAFNTTSKMQ